jgi:hypothetical protein
MMKRRKMNKIGGFVLLVVLSGMLLVPSSSALYVGTEPADGFNGAPPAELGNVTDGLMEVVVDDPDSDEWTVRNVKYTPGLVGFGGGTLVWVIKYVVDLDLPQGYSAIGVVLKVEFFYRYGNAGQWTFVSMEQKSFIHDDPLNPGHHIGYIYVGHGQHQRVIGDEYKISMSIEVQLNKVNSFWDSDSALGTMEYHVGNLPNQPAPTPTPWPPEETGEPGQPGNPEYPGPWP